MSTDITTFPKQIGKKLIQAIGHDREPMGEVLGRASEGVADSLDDYNGRKPRALNVIAQELEANMHRRMEAEQILRDIEQVDEDLRAEMAIALDHAGEYMTTLRRRFLDVPIIGMDPQPEAPAEG